MTDSNVVVLIPSPITKSDAIATCPGVILDLSLSAKKTLALPLVIYLFSSLKDFFFSLKSPTLFGFIKIIDQELRRIKIAIVNR